jgi:uncharacterized SAM-binding protein YcdF (DUF218 family)
MTVISQDRITFGIIRSKYALSLILVVFITFLGLILLFSIKSFPGHGELKRALLDKLVVVDALKDDEEKSRVGTVLYVLGGTKTGLVYKFKIATALQRRGPCDKIILLSKPGITEYDPQLKRNLTNDEWAILLLTDLAVPRKSIEPVAMKEGFFETFTEAKGMRAILSERNYTHIILVTSSYHTRRTLTTFSRVFKDRGVGLSIYSAPEPVLLRDMLYEYMKLFLYERIVLPIYARNKSVSQPLSISRC